MRSGKRRLAKTVSSLIRITEKVLRLGSQPTSKKSSKQHQSPPDK